MTVPVNSRDALNDLSDLNYHVIETIAANFIQEHGLRSIHNGELQPQQTEDSMGSELHKMLSQPLLGMRQIIPVITFWIDEFKLQFDDKLYKLEHKRLIDFQNLADQLEAMIAKQEEVSVKVKLADFLTELQYHEIHEAIPVLEQHFDLHGHPEHFRASPEQPQTPEEALERLQKLLEFSEHEINLTLLSDAKQKDDTAINLVTSELNSEERDDAPESIENQAERWLEKFKVDGVKFESFVEAYYAEPLEMQTAIDQAITTKPIHFLSTEQHPKRSSLIDRISQKLFRK
ncbi:hypothetical protein QCB45_03760 [Thiomicrorhabdus sp. ZW0627]|uniref:hypothetical protein n=1 Tax=Thiomicrorhabdus sp. ZW0627 TaxID=3039774 RepID=UPI002436D631|nr:hypothetical protein [Thiomicrorhabdus sp. ZW0627]MDG6773436.1 hypothetical protein [Thiomicrorhabdus sp. ZW0627]